MRKIKSLFACALFVLFGFAQMYAATGWVLTDMDAVEATDVCVISYAKAGVYYAVSNDQGTAKPPVATAVTVANGAITSEVTANLMWTVTKSGDNYIIYPNATTESWLYCTNTNNGVRVGTNEDNAFAIENDGGGNPYLKHVATGRYLGVYNSQDLRCYGSINSNIQNQALAVFKMVEGIPDDTTSVTPVDTIPEIPGDTTPVNPQPGEESLWVMTSIDEVSPSDVCVFTYLKNGAYYAATNDNGTAAPPAAVEVTVADGKIVSNVAANIMWNIFKANPNCTIYPNGTTETWLYCTNSNNGVRVGTGEASSFAIENDGSGKPYLKNVAQSRYVGVYNAQDWRCYQTINTNIQNQELVIFKYGGEVPPVDTTVVPVDTTVVPVDTTVTVECSFDTLSVSQAIARIDAGLLCSSIVYGKVTRLVSTDANVQKYGNVNFWMEDLANPADTLEAYKIDKAANGVKFTSLDNVKESFNVGDIVYVYADGLTIYNNKVRETTSGYFLYKVGGDVPVDTVPVTPIDTIPTDTITPVVEGITFDFSDASVYGFANPEQGKFTQVNSGDILAKDSVNIAAEFASGNGIRFFANSNSGAINLRGYVGSSLTVTAPSTIVKIELLGLNLSSVYLTADRGALNGTASDMVWTGASTSVKFNIIKSTVQINQMIITLGEGGEGGDTIPVVPPVECTFDTISVSQALARIQEGQLCECVVKGKAQAIINTDDNIAQYGNINFWMTDIDNAQDSIQAYRIHKAANRTKFANRAEVDALFLAGDTVYIQAEALTLYNNSIPEINYGYFVRKEGGAVAPVDTTGTDTIPVTPVVEGVTFDFSSQAGLEAMGLDYASIPEAGNGYPVTGNEYVREGISASFTDGSTKTRMWKTAAGALDLRVYAKGGSITLTAPTESLIYKVAMEGSAIAFSEMTGKEIAFASGTSSVTFNATATSKVRTITVWLNSEAGEGGDTIPVVPPVECTFDTISVSQALARIQAGQLCECVVKGKAQAIMNTDDNIAQYGNINFWMKDIDNAQDSIQAFRIHKAANRTKFANRAEVDALFGFGDTVYIQAEALTLYNNSTPEINYGYFVRKEGAPVDTTGTDTIPVTPVVEGVTFDFSSQAGLEAMGLDYASIPEAGNGYPVTGNEYVREGISASFTDGSTKTRMWKTAAGALDLRVYAKGGSITLTAPTDSLIYKVAMEGSAIAFSGLINNEVAYASGTSSVTFTATATSKVRTITVWLNSEAGEGGGEVPVCDFDTITVSQALERIANNQLCECVIKGKARAILTTDDNIAQYGNVEFWMEDLNNAQDSIKAFRIHKAANRAKFANRADVDATFVEGDTIYIQAEALTMYQGSTPEINYGYFVRKEGEEAPVIEPCILDTVSVSAALDLISASDVCPHVVMGIVKSMETQYLDKGNMNVTLTDVDDESKTIYCYRMIQGKGVNFSADSIPFSVGDTILVYGKTLKMYQNTPELADEVYLVEVIGGGTPFVPEPCVLDTVSVSEALALLDAADVCPHIVRGVVSSGIKIESYGAIKYLWIQDVDNPEDSICCYNMYKDSAKAVFENMNDIPFLLGDTIYVYGKSLKVYNGTKELSDLVYYVGRDGGAIQRIEIPIATIYVHSDEQFHYITAVALTGDTLFEDESWERLTYDQSVEGVYDLEYLEVNVPMLGTIELAEGSTLSVAATSMTGNNITYAVSLFAKDQYGNIYVADFEFISPDYPDDNPNITTSLAYEIARALPSGTVSTKAYNVYGYWVSNYIRKADSKVMGFYMSDFAGVTGGTYFEAYGKGGPTEGQYVVVKNINLKMYNSTAENDGSSFTYEIIDPAAAPTLRDVEAPEISVAEAQATSAGLDAGTYSPIYYTVHGFVTSVDENEFLMADDTTMVGEFKAYKCVVADGSQIGVGDEVAVRGIIQNYVDQQDATRNAYEISHGQVTVINHAQPQPVDPTALPAVLLEQSAHKAIKLVQDGQIIILKNGIRYNALGTRLDK